jgi:hypothetical protein
MKCISSSARTLGIILACNASTLTATAQPSQPPPGVTSVVRAEARSTLLHAIKPGMDFVAFRRVVLAQGWIPIAHSPPCLDQVDQALCTQLPELFDTSSGPVEYNEMSYRHPKSGERLHVVVTGDISAWGSPDAATELSVDSWDFGGSNEN